MTLYDAHGERLVKGVDYTLAYKNNVKMSDKAVIMVKGKGSYTGSFKVNFTITDKDIVEQPDEDEKPSSGSGEGEKPSEDSAEDKPAGGDGEDESGESKPDDNGTGDGGDTSEDEEREPVTVCVCNYGYAMKFYYKRTEEGASEEVAAYGEHMNQHTDKGEPSNYNDVSWKEYLKLKRLGKWYAEEPVDPWNP